MYNVSQDPMELQNLYEDPGSAARRNMLLDLLEEQRAQKRLSPISGDVPGHPT